MWLGGCHLTNHLALQHLNSRTPKQQQPCPKSTGLLAWSFVDSGPVDMAVGASRQAAVVLVRYGAMDLIWQLQQYAILWLASCQWCTFQCVLLGLG